MGSSLTSGAASYRNDFFSYKMEPNDPWLLTFFKVTTDGIADLLVKLGKVIGLSEMDSPSARAVYPPSGASSTMKISSVMSETPNLRSDLIPWRGSRGAEPTGGEAWELTTMGVQGGRPDVVDTSAGGCQHHLRRNDGRNACTSTHRRAVRNPSLASQYLALQSGRCDSRSPDWLCPSPSGSFEQLTCRHVGCVPPSASATRVRRVVHLV